MAKSLKIYFEVYHLILDDGSDMQDKEKAEIKDYS